MSYDYDTERHKIFTDEGQKTFLAIRDKTAQLLKAAGAARCQEMISGVTGDSWTMLACVDRLVELGEIRAVCICSQTCGQHQIYTRTR